ncbi:MAG TPA: hypothetical protein VLG69_01790, partial [Candidatus Andersenbacteria bacterium]|nr:hypothetical protein [Candidatus Andersenbacteria bacterium]
MFNEATGIKSLQIKIGQSQQKLKKAHDHATEVQTILEELRPRLTFLQRQMDRYDERDSYLASYKEKQVVYYHAAWKNASDQYKKTTENIQQNKQQILFAREFRIQQEKRVLDAASHQGPKKALMEQLASERARYTLAFEQWKRVDQEKRELQDSLTDITAQKKAVEKTIGIAENKHSDTDVRSTLLACKDFLDQIISDITPPKSVAQRLLQSITAILRDKATISTQESPDILLARLTAIEEERTNQLHRLPLMEKPSDTVIQNLEKSMREMADEKSSGTDVSLNVEQARQQELEAERTGASLQAMYEQQKQAIHALEQDILRECGSAVFDEIKKSPTLPDTSVTEQELRTLSAKIATIGERDPLVAKEYAETKERFDTLYVQFEDVQQTIQRIQESIDEVTATMKESFDRKFTEIKINFS